MSILMICRCVVLSRSFSELYRVPLHRLRLELIQSPGSGRFSSSPSMWPIRPLSRSICNQHLAMQLNTFLQAFNRLGLTQWEGIEEDIAWVM